MSLLNNSPSFTYIQATGISVLWNKEVYMIANFHTNKKYVFWNVNSPNQFNASNVMPARSDKQFLVLVNDNGIATEVPNSDIEVYFDGNSVQNIRDRIFGIYENGGGEGSNEDRFVIIEQDIEGIKATVGKVELDNEKLHEEVSRIEQKADLIDLSVKDIIKEYNDDKETNQLREVLNSSIIKLNSALGVFKSEFTDYAKDNQIDSDEKIKIDAQKEILNNDKAVVIEHVDTVIAIADSNGLNEDKIALESAKSALDISHTNLINNMTNAISDTIITPTDRTVITDAFAKYSQRLMSLKNTCDDIVLLGMGGAVIEELARIGIKSNEIVLSVQRIESSFKSDTSVAKIEIEKQIADVSMALDSLEKTCNTSFEDGKVDATEKNLIEEKITALNKEKTDIDNLYNSYSKDASISDSVKSQLDSTYDTYKSRHDGLLSKIRSVVSDDFSNDTEKKEVEVAFKDYRNALTSIEMSLKKAIENIEFNKASIELQKAKEQLQIQIDEVSKAISEMDGFINGTFENNILDEIERSNIRQNLEDLNREKVDIDNTYNHLYDNDFLFEQEKIDLKNSYDNYISKYDEIIKVMEDILNKTDLIDETDRVNLNSAITKHLEALSLFFSQANKSIDAAATNKVNSTKDELHQEIKDVNDRVNDILDDVGGAIADGIIDEAEAIIIKDNLNRLNKEKLDVDAKYEVIYNNPDLVGEDKTDLYNAKSDYDIKINNVISIINKIVEDKRATESERLAFENSIREYNISSANLSKAFDICVDYIANQKVNKAKEELSKDIGEVTEAVGNLEDTMNGAFKDGVLTESEKLAIKQNLLTLSSEKSDIDKQYTAIYSNQDLIEPYKSSFKTTYDSYVTSYNSLIKVINDILVKTGIIDSSDRTKLDNAFQDHNDKLGLYTTGATNAVDAIAKKKADDSKDESIKYTKAQIEIVDGKISLKAEKTEVDNSINNAVNASKEELQAKIDEANKSIEDLDSVMNGAFKDGIIDETELVAIQDSLAQLEKEKLKIDKEYEQLYNNTDLE